MTSMSMFAMYRAKVEWIILFILKEKNVFRWRQFQSFDGASIRESRACSCSCYSNKCLHLASEKFVLASESKLSLATGLAS